METQYVTLLWLPLARAWKVTVSPFGAYPVTWEEPVGYESGSLPTGTDLVRGDYPLNVFDMAALCEALGLRWNQAVRWDDGTFADGRMTAIVEVEPVPATVYGLDGEGHVQVVGRAILP